MSLIGSELGAEKFMLFEATDLKPVIAEVVAEVMLRLHAEQTAFDGRLAFTESEAAAAIGVPPHSLRDARLRQEIRGSRVGRRIVYSKEELLSFLARNRVR